MLGLIAAPLKTGAATGGPGGRMLLLAYAKDARKPEGPSFSGRPVWLLAVIPSTESCQGARAQLHGLLEALYRAASSRKNIKKII